LPYSVPTLADLLNRIGAAWRANFPGADTNLRNSPDRAFVSAIARSTNEDMSFLQWLGLQLFPFSAATEYLERWAGFRNVARKPASRAAGTVTFAGATPAMTAPAGTRLQTADGTITVELTADATADGSGNASAAARSIAGGAGTNIGTGTLLTFIGTPAGFPDTGTVGATFAGGADAETDNQLRLRTQRIYSQPSFGGNQDDWQNAALAVAGVTRVFTSPAVPTPGAVTIWPLFDAIRTNGIPSGTDAWYRPGTGPSAGEGGAGDQRAVLDAVLATRPVCAHVYVGAAATQALDITLSGLTALNDQVKANVAAEIANMLIARLAQADQQSNGIGALTTGYTIYLECIASAVQLAAGVRKFDLTLPASDVVVPAGTIAVPGLITYA